MEAAVVWTFAGAMLLTRGSMMLTASSGFSWQKVAECLVGGTLFFALLFFKIANRYIDRILNLPGEWHRVHEFFGLKGYIMMAGMISLGIFLRKSHLVPLYSLSMAYITMSIPLLFSAAVFHYSWIDTLMQFRAPKS